MNESSERETCLPSRATTSRLLPKITKKLCFVNEKHKYSHNNNNHVIGLRYEDLFNESEPAVAMAIARLSPKEREERDKRLRRALDLDFKKTTLPEEV